jgi:hypothetical protein
MREGPCPDLVYGFGPSTDAQHVAFVLDGLPRAGGSNDAALKRATSCASMRPADAGQDGAHAVPA